MWLCAQTGEPQFGKPYDHGGVPARVRPGADRAFLIVSDRIAANSRLGISYRGAVACIDLRRRIRCLSWLLENRDGQKLFGIARNMGVSGRLDTRQLGLDPGSVLRQASGERADVEPHCRHQRGALEAG